MADLNTRISDFIWKNLNEKHITGKKDPFWESLRETGTELWLDTGNIEEAEANWSAEMGALTTNNSLLNNEIQGSMIFSFLKPNIS
jgi:transaldolase